MRGRLLAAAMVVVAVLASTAAAAPSEEVTLEVDRFYDQSYGRYRLRFSGTISSGEANEYVTVMAQRCGQAFATAIAGGLTREGGSWEDVYLGFATGGTATYRARWKSHLSEPVKLRGELQLQLAKLPGGRYRVGFGADSNLSGRFVELQRLAGGRWIRLRRARLEAGQSAGYGTAFHAKFTVRGRGLTLRIVVPAKTAAPCYAPAFTPTFRS